MELLEASQHSLPDDSLQARAQVRNHSITRQFIIVLLLSVCLVVCNITPIEGENDTSCALKVIIWNKYTWS